MKFDDSTPRKEITAAGITVTVIQPFLSGHVCTENEASALNQLLVENTRNNTRDKIDKAKEAGDSPESIQKLVDEHLAGYEFGVRRGGSALRPSDPVEAMELEIAVGLVKKAMKREGISLKDTGMAQIREKAKELAAKNPRIRAKAEQMVQLSNELDDELLGA